MKRFYKDVAVSPSPLVGEGATRSGAEGGYCVLLDGKSVKTPSRKVLAVPTRALAEAIAEEWRAQKENIDTKSMPLIGFAMAAADGARMAEQALAFARSDLLCYRAEAPPELAARQAASWDALLDWAHEKYGARLATTIGIVFVEQPATSLAALETAVRGFSDFELAALHSAAAITGSLVLALALAGRRLTAAETFAAAHIDEAFQAEKWGTDAEAAARAGRLLAELESAEQFLQHLRA